MSIATSQERHSTFVPKNVVAVVTDSSRGVGKGIALELGRRATTVIVTARTTQANTHALPGTIHEADGEHAKARFEQVKTEFGDRDGDGGSSSTESR